MGNPTARSTGILAETPHGGLQAVTKRKYCDGKRRERLSAMRERMSRHHTMSRCEIKEGRNGETTKDVSKKVCPTGTR